MFPRESRREFESGDARKPGPSVEHAQVDGKAEGKVEARLKFVGHVNESRCSRSHGLGSRRGGRKNAKKRDRVEAFNFRGKPRADEKRRAEQLLAGTQKSPRAA